VIRLRVRKQEHDEPCPELPDGLRLERLRTCWEEEVAGLRVRSCAADPNTSVRLVANSALGRFAISHRK
jgi:hypothetical protein